MLLLILNQKCFCVLFDLWQRGNGGGDRRDVFRFCDCGARRSIPEIVRTAPAFERITTNLSIDIVIYFVLGFFVTLTHDSVPIPPAAFLSSLLRHATRFLSETGRPMPLSRPQTNPFKSNYSRTYATPWGEGCTGLLVRPFPQLH